MLANLTTLHGVMHGLPLTYNKDMQEDKEALFDSVDTLELCLDAAAGMLDGIIFNRDRMAAAAGDQMLAAVDIADLLVRKGVPFREAHGIVGSLVRHSIAAGQAARPSFPTTSSRVQRPARRRLPRVALGHRLDREQAVAGRHLERVARRASSSSPQAISRRVRLGADFFDRPTVTVAVN